MRIFVRALVCAFLATGLSAQSEGPVPFQSPAVSQTRVAFVYGGDI